MRILRPIRDLPRKVWDWFTHDENASVAGVIYFVLVLMIALFLYEGLGAMMDRLSSTSISLNASLDPTMYPVSQNRVDTQNYIIQAFRLLPWLGAVFPLMLYAFIVAKRRATTTE